MDKLEKRLGKLWRRVRRKKTGTRDGTKERGQSEEPSGTPPRLGNVEVLGISKDPPGPSSVKCPPGPRTVVITLRKQEEKLNYDTGLQPSPDSAKNPRKLVKIARNNSNRSFVKAQSEGPTIIISSESDEDVRTPLSGAKRPIVRRRSSKKAQPTVIQRREPSPNPALLKLYCLAHLQALRARILHPPHKKTGTSTQQTEDLKIRIPADDSIDLGSGLGSGSGYLSDASLLSSLPTLPTRLTKSRDFDKEFDESSGYESGYLSNIDLVTPRDCQSRSDHSLISTSPLSPTYGRFKLNPRTFVQSSLDGLNVKQLSPVTLPRSITLARLPPQPRDTADAFLRNNIYKTKFVTAVFEATNAGLEAVMDDIVGELTMWFGKKLVGVACEIHWSVPEKLRSRRMESRLKDEVHHVLRENNRRLLHLKGPMGPLPLRLAEAATRENCMRNMENNTFEGVYQRCYRNLLPYCHEETPMWHEPYWSVESVGGMETETVLKPRPQDYLFGNRPSLLSNTTLVSVNIAGLRIQPPRAKSAKCLSTKNNQF